MSIKIAFAGFRHSHIFGLIRHLNENSDTELVAACEEDDKTRAELADGKKVAITHDSYEKMLAEVDCDAVAIGDYYAKRGKMAIAALKAGKHVVSDKPICTSLDELAEIRSLCEKNNLCFGCQLDARGDGAFREARTRILAGELGEIHTVSFTGQHPLNLGSRPEWYFVEGCHGGTINDIAIHGIDVITWMTGRTFTEVVAARGWNARTPEFPHFQDGAQAMMKLDNGGGVVFDVSYLAPEGAGRLPTYWRFVIHGSTGMMELTVGKSEILIATKGGGEPSIVPAADGAPGEYLADFVKEINGQKGTLTTDQLMRSSYVCLVTQKAADDGATNVDCKYT